MLDWTTHAHGYQRHAADHLVDRPAAALWLSPGYGKSSVTLHAFKRLVDAGRAQHMLVVAPLRVVQTVWAQEIEEWVSLHGLRAARLHGTKKDMWLRRRDVNVWLVNYEGLPWLAKMAKAGKTPFFDVVVFDEVRRMKDSTGVRFKAARPIAAAARWRWGLTGTPASNGLMDLFGQFLILDGGAALGTRLTRFQYDFFEKGYDGFTWMLRPGAADAIEERIKDYVFRADGMLDLPDFIHDTRVVPLSDAARKSYAALKRDLIAELGGVQITAANAAVLMGKLKQMANGRVYDENRGVHEIHSAKKDALLELVEELGDEQLLIAYEYNHDLAQLREALGDDLPYLGAGVNEKTAMEHVEAWNAGRIKVLAAHPASAGHGINLQKSGAHHILWWGPTFDLDHYIQFNDRLRRQGNTASAVVVHTFVAEKTVDETALKAREAKATVQDALLSALTAEFGADILTAGSIQEKDQTMTTLQFRSDAAIAQQPANPFAPPQGGFAHHNAPQAPTPQPTGGNPFAGQAPQAAQNPFAGQAPQPAGGNPFAAGVPAPAQQVQAIRQDVAAPPPPTPQTMGHNPFAAAPAAAPAQNPFAGHAPVVEAQVVQETPAMPAQNPFAGAAPVTEQAQETVPQDGAMIGGEAVRDSGWKDPAPAAAAPSIEAPVPTAAPSGMIPLYTFIPASALDKVLAAIARAVK